MTTAHQLQVMCYMLHRKISKECLENDENTCLKCNLVNFENPKWIYRLEMFLGSKTDKITFQTGVFIIFGTLYTYLSFNVTCNTLLPITVYLGGYLFQN